MCARSCYKTLSSLPSTPTFLKKIKLPHEQKGSVSLVEIQSDQLRKKVRQLNFKLNQLVSIAKQNEKIYRVYTDLNVQLLRCEVLPKFSLLWKMCFKSVYNCRRRSLKALKVRMRSPNYSNVYLLKNVLKIPTFSLVDYLSTNASFFSEKALRSLQR